ncbi:hypothetical protein KSS87_017657 [Heliosperma pusillum]|nr:hypothetical protein KSS87_017657 [Heliosperma pusillum]
MESGSTHIANWVIWVRKQRNGQLGPMRSQTHKNSQLGPRSEAHEESSSLQVH